MEREALSCPVCLSCSQFVLQHTLILTPGQTFGSLLNLLWVELPAQNIGVG